MVLCIITSRGVKGGYIVCEDLPPDLPEAVLFKYKRVAPGKFEVVPEKPYELILKKLFTQAGYKYPETGVITIYAGRVTDLRRNVQDMMNTLVEKAGYL